MKMDSQLMCVLVDPLVYHEHFYQQYKKTLRLYESAVKAGCAGTQTIDIRLTLAENKGKLCIARGVLSGIPESTLVSLWNTIVKKRRLVNGDPEKLLQLEKYVEDIKVLCEAHENHNYSKSVPAYSMTGG